jgi:hypothetical protein
MKALTRTHKPQVKLKGIEYLLLSIQSNPERGQRWHLRRLHIYQHGRADYHFGGSNCGYFSSKSYRNVLWTDVAPKTVEYHPYWPVDGFNSDGRAMRSYESQMVLTRRGWNRANSIRKSLGLSDIEWGTQWLPDRGVEKIYQTCKTHSA